MATPNENANTSSEKNENNLHEIQSFFKTVTEYVSLLKKSLPKDSKAHEKIDGILITIDSFNVLLNGTTYGPYFLNNDQKKDKVSTAEEFVADYKRGIEIFYNEMVDLHQTIKDEQPTQETSNILMKVLKFISKFFEAFLGKSLDEKIKEKQEELKDPEKPFSKHMSKINPRLSFFPREKPVFDEAAEEKFYQQERWKPSSSGK